MFLPSSIYVRGFACLLAKLVNVMSVNVLYQLYRDGVSLRIELQPYFKQGGAPLNFLLLLLLKGFIQLFLTPVLVRAVELWS